MSEDVDVCRYERATQPTPAVNPASRLSDNGKRPAALHQGDGQRCSYSDLQLQQYAVARAGLWRSNSRLIIFDDSTLDVDFAIKRFPVGHWTPLTWKRAFLQAVLS